MGGSGSKSATPPRPKSTPRPSPMRAGGPEQDAPDASAAERATAGAVAAMCLDGRTTRSEFATRVRPRRCGETAPGHRRPECPKSRARGAAQASIGTDANPEGVATRCRQARSRRWSRRSTLIRSRWALQDALASALRRAGRHPRAPEARAQRAAEAALEAAVAATRAHPHSEAVQQWACAALRNVRRRQPRRNRAQAARGERQATIEAAVAAMRAHPQAAALQETACGTAQHLRRRRGSPLRASSARWRRAQSRRRSRRCAPIRRRSLCSRRRRWRCFMCAAARRRGGCALAAGGGGRRAGGGGDRNDAAPQRVGKRPAERLRAAG